MSVPLIPDKPAFKAGEVCEIAQIQPYVLRSWESEFPDLGLSKTPGGPRVYRRVDVERVLRIRELVFTEGLTLAGVRRRFHTMTCSRWWPRSRRHRRLGPGPAR